VDRFIAAHAIMLALVGVPGIYFHSLLGSRGWPAGVALTGHNRTINRQKLLRAELETELARPGSLRRCVFRRLARLLRVRAEQPAFDPYGNQHVLPCGEPVFALLRESRQAGERALCLHNVSGAAQNVDVDLRSTLGSGEYVDLVSGTAFEGGERRAISLSPHQVLWLRRSS
jgi:hypothetical protein